MATLQVNNIGYKRQLKSGSVTFEQAGKYLTQLAYNLNVILPFSALAQYDQMHSTAQTAWQASTGGWSPLKRPYALRKKKARVINKGLGVVSGAYKAYRNLEAADWYIKSRKNEKGGIRLKPWPQPFTSQQANTRRRVGQTGDRYGGPWAYYKQRPVKGVDTTRTNFFKFKSFALEQAKEGDYKALNGKLPFTLKACETLLKKGGGLRQGTKVATSKRGRLQLGGRYKRGLRSIVLE